MRRLLLAGAACALGLGPRDVVVRAQVTPERDPSAPSLAGLLAGERVTLDLPSSLAEASGLTLDDSGALWAHDDERAVIHRIDPGTGEVTSRTALGPKPVLGDFEGLAWDGRLFHVVTSSGTLISFAPSEVEDVDGYVVRETAAASWCEVEGVAFDPSTNELVLACKTVLQRSLAGGLVLLAVDVPPGPTASAGAPLPVRVALAIDEGTLREAGLPRRLSASGIARHPVRDTWLVVAAREARVVEVSRDGRVLAHGRLRGHPQAEGLALAPGGEGLWIADEGGRGGGRLTSYRASPRSDRRER